MGKAKITIVTDSSSYIPESATKGLDIAVIPLWLIWGEENLQDGIDIQPAEFYRRLKESNTLPTSSQPSAMEFENFYRSVAENSDQIVSVLVSSKLSGTIASARTAVSELPELSIPIVDSLNSSMGLGFAVLAAARAAAEGKSVEGVVAAAEAMKSKIQFIFIVDTLEYLHKGGRISRGKRLMGTALKIKPILQFEDGEIRPLSQARTKSKAIERVYEIIQERLGGKKIVEAAVADIDNADEADAVADQLRDQFGVTNILRADVSPVVGTHVGPGTIGIAFYTE
ncbi:MAG: DegV family protein [Anaerolineales bacterium]|uniref:DegV family protein n=1 Tax=Candidatus Desulfolinea nitratireducens TaxID=2841698 RepID=A0A8J6NK48_9CHLR|nr:DegV family protein [Candidatus Desulfolinea nitratireducens]MBL6961345.1 DegV family protein [Anaerolineales bacterium]